MRPGVVLDIKDLVGLGDLAAQPPLLTLLALYHGDGGDFTRSQGQVAILYADLVRNFLEREVRRLEPGLATDDALKRISELQVSLALAAFSMFNRGRQNMSRMTSAPMIGECMNRLAC